MSKRHVRVAVWVGGMGLLISGCVGPGDATQSRGDAGRTTQDAESRVVEGMTTSSPTEQGENDASSSARPAPVAPPAPVTDDLDGSVRNGVTDAAVEVDHRVDASGELGSGRSDASMAPDTVDSGQEGDRLEVLDASSRDDSSAPLPPAIEQPPGTIPMFVALGHGGRTTVSCDDGQSWTGHGSDDPGLRCFDSEAGNLDCDHHPSAGTGIVYAAGWFVATFGWGAQGSIRRSANGVDWEVVVRGDQGDTLTSAGLAYGNGRFLTASRNPRSAGPDAETWASEPPLPEGGPIIRQLAYSPLDGGKFVTLAGGPPVEVLTGVPGDWDVSVSGGENCTGRNIAYGRGTLLMVRMGGCRSLDGGDTWEAISPPANADTRVVWTGSEFVYFGIDEEFRTQRVSSTDGLEWRMTPAVSDVGSVRLGVVGLSPHGTFVGVARQRYYEEERFYRSTDGINWVALPSQNLLGNHPVRQIVFGYGQPSETCSL